MEPHNSYIERAPPILQNFCWMEEEQAPAKTPAGALPPDAPPLRFTPKRTSSRLSSQSRKDTSIPTRTTPSQIKAPITKKPTRKEIVTKQLNNLLGYLKEIAPGDNMLLSNYIKLMQGMPMFLLQNTWRREVLPLYTQDGSGPSEVAILLSKKAGVDWGACNEEVRQQLMHKVYVLTKLISID